MSNKKKVMLSKHVPLSSHLADYVLLIGQFLLDLAKLELKGLVKPETASSSSTRSTLHLSRLDISFQCKFESCFNILSSDVMSNSPFHL